MNIDENDVQVNKFIKTGTLKFLVCAITQIIINHIFKST